MLGKQFRRKVNNSINKQKLEEKSFEMCLFVESLKHFSQVNRILFRFVRSIRILSFLSLFILTCFFLVSFFFSFLFLSFPFYSFFFIERFISNETQTDPGWFVEVKLKHCLTWASKQ
jgi:hypothetical protein